MQPIDKALTILMIGAIGGIIYTVATHSQVLTSAFQGVNSLYSTAVKGTYGAA